jgi:hypothetical protein
VPSSGLIAISPRYPAWIRNEFSPSASGRQQPPSKYVDSAAGTSNPNTARLPSGPLSQHTHFMRPGVSTARRTAAAQMRIAFGRIASTMVGLHRIKLPAVPFTSELRASEFEQLADPGRPNAPTSPCEPSRAAKSTKPLAIQSNGEALMVCEICGAEVNEQPVRIVDGRKDPDKHTNKPPPHRYAVAVIPFLCPKCGHEQFRRV